MVDAIELLLAVERAKFNGARPEPMKINVVRGIRVALARAYCSGQAEATAEVPARFMPRDPDAVRLRGS